MKNCEWPSCKNKTCNSVNIGEYVYFVCDACKNFISGVMDNKEPFNPWNNAT